MQLDREGLPLLGVREMQQRHEVHGHAADPPVLVRRRGLGAMLCVSHIGVRWMPLRQSSDKVHVYYGGAGGGDWQRHGPGFGCLEPEVHNALADVLPESAKGAKEDAGLMPTEVERRFGSSPRHAKCHVLTPLCVYSRLRERERGLRQRQSFYLSPPFPNDQWEKIAYDSGVVVGLA